MRGQRGKVAFFSQGVSVCLVVTAVALVLFSCGLPTSDYLYSPSDFSYNGGIVTLQHNTGNDESDIADLFRGYDIYYRIFDNVDDAKNSYDKLYDLYEDDDRTFSTSDVEGYYVLVKENDKHTPLISVSDITTYGSTFYLNLYESKRWTITSEEDRTIYSVFRDKDDSTTTTSTDADFYLSGEYSSDDHDYEDDGDDGISSGSSVYIVFLAVSYGVSSSLSDLYSVPIVLEPVTYTPGS